MSFGGNEENEWRETERKTGTELLKVPFESIAAFVPHVILIKGCRRLKLVDEGVHSHSICIQLRGTCGSGGSGSAT
jgi:hypothetical protein